MSTEKKLVAYHIARLTDKNAEVRLRSVQELAELGDPDALETLKALYRDDPDAVVRKAAQEAGRVIYVKNQPKK